MEKRRTMYTKDIVLCALFTTLIAVGGFIKIPIPYVPFTLQYLFTNLAGLLLGRKRGSVSVAMYIWIGLMGIPIFTAGGGIGYIVHPTFGYLVGYLLGAYVAGFIIEKVKEKSTKVILMASFINITIVYVVGMAYFYIIQNFYLHSEFGIQALLIYCFAVLIPGDVIKCLLSAILYKRLVPVMEKI